MKKETIIKLPFMLLSPFLHSIYIIGTTTPMRIDVLPMTAATVMITASSPRVCKSFDDRFITPYIYSEKKEENPYKKSNYPVYP